MLAAVGEVDEMLGSEDAEGKGGDGAQEVNGVGVLQDVCDTGLDRGVNGGWEPKIGLCAVPGVKRDAGEVGSEAAGLE